MDIFALNGEKDCTDPEYFQRPGKTDTTVQFVISAALGFSALIAFCFLRPRWQTLYNARKRHLPRAAGLPALPASFFGWMPALYRISERQVLASAGLDAYVFLNFFKLAIKLFAAMLLFAAFVLEPINRHFPEDGADQPCHNTTRVFSFSGQLRARFGVGAFDDDGDDSPNCGDISFDPEKSYLWAYLVFTYFFTLLTIWFLDNETFKVLRVRQNYLGSQSTVTDRTFQLTGIPHGLRSEDKIKELVEKLEIGLVESVSLCRNWKELDDMVELRHYFLQRLEEAWSDYLRRSAARTRRVDNPDSRSSRSDTNGPIDMVDEEAGENERFLSQSLEGDRPQTRMWYGFLRLQSQRTDAIDYYEEKLRRLDEKIVAARKKTYEPTNLAFVTMDSTAACQMAIQALIDPQPGHLQTSPAPSPSDIVWRNTYASKLSRKSRQWAVTAFVGVLTIIWVIPVPVVAGLVSLCSIRKVFPSLAESLSEHAITKALVQTGLPTLVISLLNVAVPYFYDYLSHHQGSISRGDIALSAISKNFFFTFFNLFIVITVFGSAINFATFRDSVKDTTSVPYRLAKEIQNWSVFYLNFIMLQGLGLFPFRLLEFGSVALFPYYKATAKTPRDAALMKQPPIFNYSFYIPTALLVFILCLAYSVLRSGYLVLLMGLIYFVLGYFTYKYQLLYAMDQPQHATGGAWRIICFRILLGLVVFQLTMSGVLALKLAITEALLVVPVLLGTIWYSLSFKRHFEPLTRYISLRSIRRGGDGGETAVLDDDHVETEAQRSMRMRRASTIDEDREKNMHFVNPSLVEPLEQPWIYRDPPPRLSEEVVDEEAVEDPEEYRYQVDVFTSGQKRDRNVKQTLTNAGAGDSNTSSSSMSLGDTHVWREQ